MRNGLTQFEEKIGDRLQVDVYVVLILSVQKKVMTLYHQTTSLQ